MGTEIFLFRLPAEPGWRLAVERKTCVLSCWHNHSGCWRDKKKASATAHSVLFDRAADDSPCCMDVAQCVIKSFLLYSLGSLTEGPVTAK